MHHQLQYRTNSNSQQQQQQQQQHSSSTSSWLSPERRHEHDRSISAAGTFLVVESGPSPSRDVERFQSLKQQLESFREATDPKIALGLGIDGPRFSANQQQHQRNAIPVVTPSSTRQPVVTTMMREIPDSASHHGQQQQRNNNNSNNRSSTSSSINNAASRAQSNVPNSRSPSITLIQPPGLLGSTSHSSRPLSLPNYGNNAANIPNQRQQEQQQQQQRQQVPNQNPPTLARRPPTVVQVDGSFRFIVPAHHLPPPPAPPEIPSQQQQQQQKPQFSFYQQHEEDGQGEGISNSNINSISQPRIQTVTLKPSANFNVHHHHRVAALPQTPNDISVISLSQTGGANRDNLHTENATATTVGRSLFGADHHHHHDHDHHQLEQQQQQQQSSVVASSSSSKRVATEEKPPWIGPLDATTSVTPNSSSKSSLLLRHLRGRRTTPSPATASSRARRRRTFEGNNNNDGDATAALSPSFTTTPTTYQRNRTRSGNNNNNSINEVCHLLQDGRRVVFKGSTHERLTEETLYTGQSKIRFAWKQADFLVGGEYGFAAHTALGLQQVKNQHTAEGTGNGAVVVVDDSALYRQRGAEFDDDDYSDDDDEDEATNYLDRADSESQLRRTGVDISQFVNNNNNNNNNHTDNDGNQNDNNNYSNNNNYNYYYGNNQHNLASLVAVHALPRNIPNEPKILDLMKGPSIAAEQLRRAKTEGERRTAETLMRRQAWKALHPGAMDWHERTWKDTLRPSAVSARGGADNFDDARHFTMYAKERPEWKCPGGAGGRAQGPTLTQLREAPVVVNLSLEDLKVTPNEDRVLEHIASQQRHRRMVLLHGGGDAGNNMNNYNNGSYSAFLPENTLIRPPVVTRCDEPPPTPVDADVDDFDASQQQTAVTKSTLSSIGKALPVDASNFSVHNSSSSSIRNAQQQQEQQWKISPNIENAAGLPTTAAQKNLIERKQQQFVLPSRAIRDAMASFGDPNKSILASAGSAGLSLRQPQ